AIRTSAGRGAPEKDRRSENDRACGITEPPCQPDVCVVGPWSEMAGAQGDHADRRAPGGRYERAKSEVENVGGAEHPKAPARQGLNHVGCEDRFQGIAERYGRRGGRPARGGDVHSERAEKDNRPEFIAQNQQGSQSDPRRRPNGRGTCVHKSEAEPQLSGQEVSDKQENCGKGLAGNARPRAEGCSSAEMGGRGREPGGRRHDIQTTKRLHGLSWYIHTVFTVGRKPRRCNLKFL